MIRVLFSLVALVSTGGSFLPTLLLDVHIYKIHVVGFCFSSRSWINWLSPCSSRSLAQFLSAFLSSSKSERIEHFLFEILHMFENCQVRANAAAVAVAATTLLIEHVIPLNQEGSSLQQTFLIT